MRVNRVADVGGFAAHFDGEGGFGDQVTGMRADDAGADDAVRGFVENQFGEAFGATEANGAT